MNAKTQQERLLEALKRGPVTTKQARAELGINEPSRVVGSLLKNGYIIRSYRTGNRITYAMFPPGTSKPGGIKP